MILDNIELNSLNYLIHIHQIDIILSDIFDTIICRKVHPESIKQLVAARLSILFPRISPTDFYQIRKNAEQYCYSKYKISYGEKEINYPYLISTIYELLKKKYHSDIFLTKNEFFLAHQSIELAIEYRNQIPDTHLVNFIRKQKAKGIKIILLSDFYMSSDLVNSMLTFHNIEDIYDHLFVSSDVMKTKRSGKLYQEIINNSALCHSSNILMMGDNYYSDIVMAEQFGLKTFYVERKQQNIFYNQQQKLSESKKACLSAIDQLINHQEDGIFEYLPLLLLHIINKLYHRCLKHKIKKLYFLSREGKIIKDLFDQYQLYIHAKQFSSQHIATHYLLASRRSTAAASLGPLNHEEFTTLFRQYTNISIKQFSLSYSFDIEKIKSICDSQSIDMDEIQNHLPSSDFFKRLKKDIRFIEYYEDFRKHQRINFIDYLQSINFTLHDEQLTLFDIGWKGSMQDNISKIFPNTHIHGYYLGLVAPGAMHSHNVKEGILFDFRQKNKNYWIYHQNLSLFEIILNADHGSAKQYSREDNGDVIVDLEFNDKENQLFLQKISLIHQKIHENFSKLLLLFDNYALGTFLTENYAIDLLKQKIFSPNKKEVEWLIDVQHFENFGLFTHSQIGSDLQQLSTPPIKNLFTLIKSPKKYIRSTFWPFLKLSKDGLWFIARLYRWYLLYLKSLFRT
ncbi:HAD-IA family hydrolase [Rickettsiella endosymbiont of Aleochara curtula]|uniref:HAD-IA family hydrolase n=1 Tax=Rickettsiella endosymbiont of Aleochara curtula TaxID=3077936 RepID=UPI00313B0230